MKLPKYQSVVVIGLIVFIGLGVLAQLEAGWLLPTLESQGKRYFLLSVMKMLEYSGITTFINIGSGVVLFLLTREKKTFCILWAFLGLSLGVVGVVLFFVTELYEKKSSQ